MPRIRRHYVPGAVHHAISRFHGGAYRLRDREERSEYLRRLASALERTDWTLLAFALMSTHVHLAFLAGVCPPGALFRVAHAPFARWLNVRQQSIGNLFAGRFQLWAVKRPPGELLAYLHNNPVRANVVAAAASSPWTSHRFYLDPRGAPAWLDVERGMALAGFSEPASFDDYVRSRAHEPRDPTWRGGVDRDVLQHIQDVGGAAVELGEPTVADATTYEILLRPRGFADIRHDFSPEQIIDAVERVMGVPAKSFRGRSRTRPAARGRRLALRLWRRMRGPQAEMCAALGMSPSAACELLNSTAAHHRLEDEEVVWAKLLESYPQKI